MIPLRTNKRESTASADPVLQDTPSRQLTSNENDPKRQKLNATTITDSTTFTFQEKKKPLQLHDPLDDRIELNIPDESDRQSPLSKSTNPTSVSCRSTISRSASPGLTNTDVPADVLQRLKQFSLFNEAPDCFFVKLARTLKLFQFRPQECIVKSGEPAKSMYWILRGTVGVTSTDGESIYAELAPGSFFGEIGILFNRPRTATVIARTKVLVGVLTKDALNSILGDYPDLERIIRQEAQERLYMQEQREKLSKMSTPTISRKISIIPDPINDPNELVLDNQFVDSSLAANDHDMLPGPSLPPMIQNPRFISNEQFQKNYLTNPTGQHIDNNSFANIDNIDQSISIRDFLCNLDIFKSLPDIVIHELALSIEVLHYRPMEYIFRKGDSGRDIFFIVYGEVEVINESELLARLGPMMYFGEFAFLSTLNQTILNQNLQTRSANIRTITDCEILMIKASTLDEICVKCPHIFESFKLTASQRIKTNNDLSNNENNLFKKINFKNTNSIIELSPNGYEFSDIEQGPDDINSEPPEVFKNFSLNDSTNTNSLSTPIMNPNYGSLQRLSNITNLQNSSKFRYTPLEYRQRLLDVNRNRRRSSFINIGPFSDSILIKILGFLNLKELAKLSTVCIRWKQLIYLSDKLAKTLDLSPWCKEMTDLKFKNIAKFVGTRPEIVNISNCYHVTDEGFTHLINSIGIRGNIKELNMSNNWNLSGMAIMDISLCCRNLVTLDLSNCRKVKDEVLARVIGFKGNNEFGCRKLRNLKLGYCKYLTDKSLQHLMNNSKLFLLDLTRCTTITDMGFQNCFNLKFYNIKKLVLKDCTFLSDKTVEMITVSCVNLEILDLTFCCMLSDYSIKLISHGCKRLINLNLSFCGSAVSDYSLSDLRNLTHLKKLSIKGCVRVTREGVDMLLTKLQRLETLNILQCPKIDYYKGTKVDPFDRIKNCNYSCLKIKPHGRVIKVFL